jgi:hypothetical protein
MTIELPLLRLGLAGFSAEQQDVARAVLGKVAGAAAQWELSSLEDADAWWVNGARTELLAGDAIRVTGGRALQMQLSDVDRPVAFSRPLPPALSPTYAFDPNSPRSMGAVLEKFESWLAPVCAQFCLGAHVAEHQAALRPGIYDVSLSGTLLAVVDMRGEVGVLPAAGPGDFEDAVWGLRSGTGTIPDNFVRSSLSHLLWQYATRTHRDLLPRHYRSGPLFFRRAPRLAQRMLSDSHLLLMRELVLGPATFAELQQRCGFDEAKLARDLAALYFVGSITSNPKRAAVPPGPHSSLPSHLDWVPPPEVPARKRPVPSDLTAPAHLGPR